MSHHVNHRRISAAGGASSTLALLFIAACGGGGTEPGLGFGDTHDGPDFDAVPSDVAPLLDVADTSDATLAPDVPMADDTDPGDLAASSDGDASAIDAPGDTAEAVDPTGLGPLDVSEAPLTVAGYDATLFVPEADAPVPAVVLAPGFQIDGPPYHGYARHLASHGVAVLVPTFGDSLARPIAHSDLADAIIEMVDALADDPRFDPGRLGAGGHSRGGKASILAATRDPRIRASFNLDPVDSVGPNGNPTPNNPSVTPELMGGLTIPLGLVGTSRGGISIFPGLPECAPAADNYDAYARAAVNADVFVALPPLSGHNDFPDPLPFLLRLACPAGDDPGEVRLASQTWMTAFYRVHLADDVRYAPWLVAP
jgi:hypothetical protein